MPDEELTVNVNTLIKNFTIKIGMWGTATLGHRLSLARWLFRWGAWILGTDIVIDFIPKESETNETTQVEREYDA